MRITSSKRVVSGLLAAGLILGGIAGQAWADGGYLCIEEMKTGFPFDKSQNQWRQSNLKADGKYIISKATPKDIEITKDSRSWVVKQTGYTMPFSLCKEGINDDGILFCKGFVELRINTKMLRFLAINAFGYWDVENSSNSNLVQEGTITPSMAIGKCSVF